MYPGTAGFIFIRSTMLVAKAKYLYLYAPWSKTIKNVIFSKTDQHGVHPVISWIDVHVQVQVLYRIYVMYENVLQVPG